MLAQRRDDVADLNARAREHMRAAGALGDRELRLPGGRFAVGDHVIVKRNDLRRGIVNGERGRVIGRRPRRAPAHARLPAANGSRSTPTTSTTAPSTATRRSCTATRSPSTSPRA